MLLPSTSVIIGRSSTEGVIYLVFTPILLGYTPVISSGLEFPAVSVSSSTYIG